MHALYANILRNVYNCICFQTGLPLLPPKPCIELCFLPFRRIFNFRENVDYMLFVTSNDSWSFPKTDSVSRNCQLVYMNKEGDSNIRKLNLVSICSPTFF